MTQEPRQRWDTPDGWERTCGPVRSVPIVTREGLREGCVTVGNRVRGFWQRFGHMLGNGTIIGFERHIETGWIRAVIDYDYPTDLSMGDDGYVRWDYDRLCLCPGHWDGETQEQSVGRWRSHLTAQREKATNAA
jgi:hypothetical protein